MTTPVFVRHYSEVADASPVPVLLYNVTMFTGVTLHPDAVEQLAHHPNIVGMKESGSDLALISENVTRTPDSFTVLAGSATTLFHSLCAGCDGAILALAALVPDACLRMRDLIAAGRLSEARELQQQLLPLARSVGSRFGVAGLKAALDLAGYRGGAPRPPLLPLADRDTQTIRQQLESLALLPVQA
jgi:4-hydroxy-2-oxoglutarate aldolase